MHNSLTLTILSALAFITRIIAQDCVDPGYLLCLPAGSNLGGVPSSSLDDSDFWDNLAIIAAGSVVKRDLAQSLAKRQDALCCSPDPYVECLVTTADNIPFCYVRPSTLDIFSYQQHNRIKAPTKNIPLTIPQDTITTQYVFSDDSFGYLDNGTYYAADGTFVDFDKGYYSSIDGTTGTFAAATATAAPKTASVTNTADVTHAPGGGNRASVTHVPNAPVTTAPAKMQPTATQQPQKESSGAVREMGSGYGVSGFVALGAVLMGFALFF